MATSPETTPTTNAGNGDRGTNASIRTFVQTQATSFADPRLLTNSTGGINSVTGEALNTAPPTSAGVGQNDDATGGAGTNVDQVAGNDAGSSYGGATQEEYDAITKAQQGTVTGALNSNSRRQITPRGNILDRFASYTYRASVYLMNPQEYAQLVRSNKKNINGYNLLFQSGGAPVGKGGFTGALNANANDATGGANTINVNAADAGRNPAFSVDFFIDSITINNLIQGKSTGTAHTVSGLKFTVIEPMGITLIDRIYQAVQDHAPKEEGTGKINYSTAQYLMVLRWYGYDIDGNLIKGGPTLSDPNAVVEKFIPFCINTINWSVGKSLVTYDFDCTPVGQIIGGGTRRGTVPYDIQLSSGTVAGVLGGSAIYTNTTATAAAPGASTTINPVLQGEYGEETTATPPPPKANAAGNPSKIIKAGLMGALNEFNQQLTTGKRPIYQFPDQYEIVFAGEAKQLIGDATIVLPGKKKESKLGSMGPVVTKDANAANPDSDQKNNTIVTKSIVAGQPVVQVIEEVIRNSSYVTSQQLTQINPDTNEEEPNPNAKNKPVNWFRINFEAVPTKPDNLRNDYAYKIRYVISVYKLDKYDSKYFPVGTFRGVHKSYPWWFTGKNTAIIDYQETLNSAYTMLVSGSNDQNSAAETERRKIAASMRDLVVYSYGATSSESMQGSKERGNEASANLADSLYASADLGTTKMRIIGDPAWIQQGSLSGSIDANNLDTSSFLPDGTINYDAEQILFEVAWNRPEDYDLTTGLSTPNGKKTPISRVYIASSVTSEFRQGKFEQTIEGLLFNIPKPDGSNKALTAPLPVKEVERETRDSRGRLTAESDPRVAAMQASLAPQVNVNPANNVPENLNTPPPGPNDGAAPSPPPLPPTSGSGENLNVGDPFVPPGRLTRDSLEGVQSTPQIISRDW